VNCSLSRELKLAVFTKVDIIALYKKRIIKGKKNE